jgi:hypothetical protein
MEDNTMNHSRCRITVHNTPQLATLACHADDPELPKLTATVETRSGYGVPLELKICRIYVEKNLLVLMHVCRGKNCAIRIVRGAMLDAMSYFGRKRRLAKNKKSRAAAVVNKEGE